MIKFENIQIKFDDFIAINDLSLEIEKGEFFTFLGPSGCGKTTTLRSLVGFITPTKGHIYLDEEDITNKPIEKRHIGMVFQSYALFPTMTVEDNIKFGLIENKWDKNRIDAKVKEVAEMVNINPKQLKKNVSQLSGGQQQRVAIARALALEPDIICLDEPLSNLDAKLRASLRVELKNIQRKSNTTMIYVTHDQEEALAISDRIAVFSEGEIQQVGSPHEIYYNPKTPFVATFIGDRFAVTDKFMKSVEAHNEQMRFDRDYQYYIRTEGIRIKGETDLNRQNVLTIPATILREEFLGTTIRRVYDVNGDIVPSFIFSKGAKIADKPDVEIVFDQEDLISFRKD
ncbi:ABC transporter ATP-binding protein [Streptococcus halichoeri]|uniref:ABC transporter ATP-binding protein n=1 Tax=Streptococcus halichoeri TaxID=254785 RepID=UPI00135872C1|nr:ABC transporter ATP-binding protein [Streptococcus halichoeri]